MSFHFTRIIRLHTVHVETLSAILDVAFGVHKGGTPLGTAMWLALGVMQKDLRLHLGTG